MAAVSFDARQDVQAGLPPGRAVVTLMLGVVRTGP